MGGLESGARNGCADTSGGLAAEAGCLLPHAAAATPNKTDTLLSAHTPPPAPAPRPASAQTQRPPHTCGGRP